MTAVIGSVERPLRVAVIGAGPSGFYAAQELLRQNNLEVSVDLIEQLPAPHGLVRYGVAPDHQKIKSVTKLYDRIAADPRLRFLGNVKFGVDLTHEDVLRHYDQVIYTVGAQTDRRLDIPGEDLIGSYPATDFVAWYNGHPDYAHLQFDLSCENVAVIGVGNVAMDVARILALSPHELEQTDIADHALEALRQSKVKNIYVIARRGPAQVKFTNPELRELAELEVTDVIIDPAELQLDPLSAAAIADNREAQTNIDIMRHYAEMGDTGHEKKIHFLFLRSPVEIIGDEAGRVVATRIEKNELRASASGYLNAYGAGEFETLEIGMIMRSIGYRGDPLPGVPFHERWGVISNHEGRVTVYGTDEIVPREYCAGWIKRGPSGIIGTNKPDSVATVRLMLADLPTLDPATAADTRPEAVTALLQQRGVRYVTWDEWQMIDAAETEAGQRLGRPRRKFVTVSAMLQAIADAIAAQTQDLLIIGGGPAGLYAAFYAGLRGLKTRLVEAMPTPGGQLAALYPEMDIYDVPGFARVNALELVEALEEQAQRFAPDVKLVPNCRAERISRENGIFLMQDCNGEQHRARRLIIAVGIGAVMPNKIEDPAIAKFEGNGVYYFAHDRSQLRSKRVLIVGGGDTAVLWALNLKDWAAQVTLIHRRDRFRAREGHVAELLASGVAVRTFHELKEVRGKRQVEQAVIADTRSGEERVLDVDAVVLCLGFHTDRSFVSNLELALSGSYVRVDHFMRTNVEGVYAIGDASEVAGGENFRLIATAMAEAAIAVNHACHSIYPDKRMIPPHSSALRL